MADTKGSAFTSKTSPIPADSLTGVDSAGPTNARFTMQTMHYVYTNQSVTAQGPGFATDTYLTGSRIVMPAGAPSVGTQFRCIFIASKTAAGIVAPIIQLRFGTAGTTADTSICSFTLSAGTAATDTGQFEVIGLFRTVGSGTSAVVQGSLSLTSQATTGFSSLTKTVLTTSAGFNSSTAGAGLGVSVNGGTSAAWTVQLVRAELML